MFLGWCTSRRLSGLFAALMKADGLQPIRIEKNPWMIRHFHIFPEFFLLAIATLIQLDLTRRARATPAWQSLTLRLALVGANLGIAALMTASFLSTFPRVWRQMPSSFAQWLEAVGAITSLGLMGLYLGFLIWRQAPKYQARRRKFLQAAGASFAVATFTSTSIGILSRHNIGLNELKIRIPNLPKDLDGLRLVQVTDIHLGPGDLISRPGDPLDACLGQLARLRAEAGMLGCLGNHEAYTGTEDYVTRQAKLIGIEFLRKQARLFQFGKASINFAGVDYQGVGKPYLIGAEKLLARDSTNILLSHNPDVFTVAARHGYDLTLAGHTHGGQVNFEILHRNVNPALYFTRFVRGLYRRQGKAVYVCSGLGTIGVPVRLGAPAEVSLIHLSV